jgi:hypothetical protein
MLIVVQLYIFFVVFGCCFETLSLWIPLGQYCLTASLRDIHRCPVGVGTVNDPHLGHNNAPVPPVYHPFMLAGIPSGVWLYCATNQISANDTVTPFVLFFFAAERARVSGLRSEDLAVVMMSSDLRAMTPCSLVKINHSFAVTYRHRL